MVNHQRAISIPPHPVNSRVNFLISRVWKRQLNAQAIHRHEEVSVAGIQHQRVVEFQVELRKEAKH